MSSLRGNIALVPALPCLCKKSYLFLFIHCLSECLPTHESVRFARRATIAEEVRYEPDEEELERRRKARKSQQADNPNYLKGSTKSKRDTKGLLERDMMLIIEKDEKGHRDKDSKKRIKLKKKEGRKKNKTTLLAQEDNEDREEEEEVQAPTVKTQMELPDGARMSDSDDDKDVNDPHRALDIDLAASMDLLPSTYSLGSASVSKLSNNQTKNHIEKAV